MYMQQSAANLLSVSAMAPMAEATALSVLPRLSCAATALYSGCAKPRSSVVIIRSSGNELPYPAAEPNGFISVTAYAPRRMYMSSARASAYAPNHSPKDEGMAICPCV